MTMVLVRMYIAVLQLYLILLPLESVLARIDWNLEVDRKVSFKLHILLHLPVFL